MAERNGEIADEALSFSRTHHGTGRRFFTSEDDIVRVDFIDLRTRAELLDLCGDIPGAERLRTQSLKVAREVDLTCYAYQLMWRDKIDEAIDILEVNASAHPESWNVRHSLGEAYEMLGDYPSAAQNFRIAMTLTENRVDLAQIGQSLRRVAQFEAAAS